MVSDMFIVFYMFSSISIYTYQYSCLRLLAKGFSSKTSLQYKPYDAYSTCIANFISTNLLTLHTKQYLLTLAEAVTINEGWTKAQHRHNADTSVTFPSLSSLTKKKEKK